MKTIVINNFSDYIECVSKFTVVPNHTRLFRGQPGKYSLLPAVARGLSNKDTTKVEMSRLKELMRRGERLLNFKPKDTWDWLVYAQHFGLKTRLLDWTLNPLTALWFASKDNPVVDGYVYFFLANKEFNLDKSLFRSPFSINNTKIVIPIHNNSRIAAQNGIFTVHMFTPKAKRFVPLEDNNNHKAKLTEIVIPYSIKKEIVSELNVFGINYETMFPDFEGLCKQINQGR
jgi:hypothetical protein